MFETKETLRMPWTFVFLVILTAALSLGGACTDREVATGAAVVAAGATVVAVVAASNAHDDDHDGDDHVEPSAKRDDYHHRHRDTHRKRPTYGGGYDTSGSQESCKRRQVCYVHFDYYGTAMQKCKKRRVCRRGDGSGHRHSGYGYHKHRGEYGRDDHYHNRRFAAGSMQDYLENLRESLEQGDKMEDVVSAFDFARFNYLSLESATRLLSALDDARLGDDSSLVAIGFTYEDLEDLARLRLPSDDCIEAVAQELDQMPVMTKAMLARMIRFARDHGIGTQL